MIQDIRYALRLLLRDRGFTCAALLSLALGIGAATGVFSVVDRILFRALPYADDRRLVSIGLTAPMLPYDFMFGAGYLDFRRAQTAFAAVTSWSGVNDCDLTEGEPVRLSCAAVEATFLPTLGILPVAGRNFALDEDAPTAPGTALISYGLWRSRFGGDPGVIGRTLSIDGARRRVVGVLPADFETPTLARADLVIPQALDDATLARAVTGRPLRVIARMRAGTTVAQAHAAADTMAAHALAGAPPGMAREVKAHVKSLRDLRIGDAKTAAWVLFGSVLAVLLLGSSNVANLLLARNVARRNEMSIRRALGAGRVRLARQALTESLVISIAGGAAGCALAYGLVAILGKAAPLGIPQIAQAAVDLRVLLFALLCAVVSAMVFGIGPALDRQVPSRSRVRPVFIVAQLALSLALLTGAGLLIETLWRFEQIPLGMEIRNIATASVSLPVERYATASARLGFAEEWERRLQNAGFTAAAVADSRPPEVPLRSKPLAAQSIDGRAQAEPAAGTVVWRAVTPGYFAALGIAIRRGRAFIEQDRDTGRDVMIVSESLAARLLRGSNPVGHFMGGAEIVGVAADVRNSGGAGRGDPEFYVPRNHASGAQIYAAPDELRRVVAIVRTPLSTAAVARELHEMVASLDASLPVSIETVGESAARLSARPRFNAMLLAAFAAVGLILSGVGVYGVLGFVVSMRTREIGIRMALGATPQQVVAMVMAGAVRWLAVGVVFGWLLSAGLSRALGSLLFNVARYDPAVWSMATAVLIGAALAAAWRPSRRASRVDPMQALREE
jgi:putative ABC transport system permease protein